MFKEDEIRPTNLMCEQTIRYARDVERLMRHRQYFVVVPCPACQSTLYSPVFTKYGMQFVRCDRCETIYANPRPNAAHMEEYYRNSENYEYWNKYIFPASEIARREKIFQPRVELVLDICTRLGIQTNSLLEVGAGFGTFCQELQKHNAFRRIIAVEPTPDLADTCRQRGLETIEKSIEKIQPEEVGGQVDVIVSFEVIEHLFCPHDYLLKCVGLLKDGGFIILTCPNSKGFDIVVMNEISSAVDTEHVNLFNLKSLSYLMESCGLQVVEKKTPGKLDAELVRKKALSGEFNLNGQAFLRQTLLDEWEECGESFQRFLSENCLSSNMLVVARKPFQ